MAFRMTRALLVAIVAVPMFLVALPAASAAPGGGEGGDPYADKLEAYRRKAAELRAAGRTEEADRMDKEIRAFEEKAAASKAGDAERQALKQRVAELQERAAKAKAEGRADEAADAMRQAEELMRKAKGDRPKSEAPTKTGGGGDDDLARMADDLRAKARAAREAGNERDADHLQEKVGRIEKTLKLRAESNEAERQAKAAREAGREGDARELAEKSGRLWRESEETLSGAAPGAAPQKKKAEFRDPLLDGTPETVTGRIAGLRKAAANLRESGLTDEAAKMEARADALDRALAERARTDGARSADVEAMKAELEKLRRRAAELEEEIRRREAK